MSGISLRTILLGSFLMLSSVVFSQHKPTSCTAVFIDNQMLVDEYTGEGQCIIDYNAKGSFTVQIVDLSSELCHPTGHIRFRLSIRRGSTNTLISFSDKNFTEMQVEDILAKCQPGDSILVLTVDEEYSLPHHEIIVHYALKRRS